MAGGVCAQLLKGEATKAKERRTVRSCFMGWISIGQLGLMIGREMPWLHEWHPQWAAGNQAAALTHHHFYSSAVPPRQHKKFYALRLSLN